MIVKVIDYKTMFGSEEVQYYFEDENHNLYYWVTDSNKAWELLPHAKAQNITVQITSHRLAEKWTRAQDAAKIQTIKNVKFRLLG